jgi:CheY-like chemotaxis protein
MAILRLNQKWIREAGSLEEKEGIRPDEILFDKATILLVDDIESNCTFIEETLSFTNLDIVVAQNGAQALELARLAKPDLIITDIRMPVMDGFELLKQLRIDKNLKDIHVVAYTAAAMLTQQKQLREAGFDSILIKPTSIMDLYRTLASSLPFSAISDNTINPREQDKEVIENLADLLILLETNLMEEWQKLSKNYPIQGIKAFGEQLSEIGEKHNAAIIAGFGRNIVIYAENFEVDKILLSMKQFPEIVSKLKLVK